MPMQYVTYCVNISISEVPDLQAMIDRERQITYHTAMRRIGKHEMARTFPVLCSNRHHGQNQGLTEATGLLGDLPGPRWATTCPGTMAQTQHAELVGSPDEWSGVNGGAWVWRIKRNLNIRWTSLGLALSLASSASSVLA